jgi:hypothetical protein
LLAQQSLECKECSLRSSQPFSCFFGVFYCLNSFLSTKNVHEVASSLCENIAARGDYPFWVHVTELSAKGGGGAWNGCPIYVWRCTRALPCVKVHLLRESSQVIGLATLETSQSLTYETTGYQIYDDVFFYCMG